MNDEQTGRLEERQERQNAEQQHGDTFAVDSDEPTDTSGIPRDSQDPADGGAPSNADQAKENERRAEEDGRELPG